MDSSFINILTDNYSVQFELPEKYQNPTKIQQVLVNLSCILHDKRELIQL